MISKSLILSLIVVAGSIWVEVKGFCLKSRQSEIFLNNNHLRISRGQHASLSLYAKKKNTQTGKGFGKVSNPPQSTTPKKGEDPNAGTIFQQEFASEETSGLTSISSTSSQPLPSPTADLNLDPNLTTEERTKAILKQKYGLRTFEEQQGDIKAAQKIAENSKRMSKIKSMSDEEFDIFQVLPASLTRGIDAFLKIGLSISTVVFVLMGVGITAEAWSVATKKDLPENIDSFIVNNIEPNFTPMLFVLLGFSISLGIFATAQLGSASSQYKEKP
mmetsp:Transcript_3639/g.5020  ORF Transcript_3639/g.5020 Transcript_3639/m.5020 type:complete len:274 (+) Transcript_3639:108-929(+)|eukprot:CAMPEP_0184866332 /NCGR_PEP_ID=MMETSP0580-20130426/21918_1 /TAXON_ID=1118495 /ORGANISM="Dactyliosolen fragilissimus" /LENGTH=273 /DNA_ID=CAMNT_0027365963 /DNA_START=39 /DNA_END=860 /DNA_ORIENTATION=-